MKILIIFREGHSGHYLKSLIEEKPVDVKFRMDPWQPGQGEKTLLPSSLSNCVCLHHSPGQAYENQFDLVLRILPDKKIYHAIYNIFQKKMLVEEFSQQEYQNWTQDPIFWYDKVYYHIQEYYDKISADISSNHYSNVINFDLLLDQDYMNTVFKQYFNQELSETQISLMQQYRSLQLDIDLPLQGKTMQEILWSISDEMLASTPWFASYCIYKYEKNNGLTEADRLWSIDQITTAIDKKFLLSIEPKYCF